MEAVVDSSSSLGACLLGHCPLPVNLSLDSVGCLLLVFTGPDKGYCLLLAPVHLSVFVS